MKQQRSASLPALLAGFHLHFSSFLSLSIFVQLLKKRGGGGGAFDQSFIIILFFFWREGGRGAKS